MRKALLVITLLLLGCGSSAGSVPTIDFDNVAFLSTWAKAGKVRLTNGEYRERVAPGSAAEIVVTITDSVAFGTVDGNEAAAVVLATSPGGSGIFYELALVVKGAQGWINEDVALLGDRTPVRSVVLENGAISVYLTTHSPQDAMCCPTRHVVQKYIVQERRLVKTDEGALEEPDQSLITTVWLWHQTVYNDDRKVIPLNPDHYTLKMLPDGKVNIRADCNLGGGFHRLNDGGISIEITYSTRAACPPESMDQIYVRDLNAAAKWFLKNDGLYVELKDGAGTMSFRRQ